MICAVSILLLRWPGSTALKANGFVSKLQFSFSSSSDLGIILELWRGITRVHGAPRDYVLQLLTKVACVKETKKSDFQYLHFMLFVFSFFLFLYKVFSAQNTSFCAVFLSQCTNAKAEASEHTVTVLCGKKLCTFVGVLISSQPH